MLPFSHDSVGFIAVEIPFVQFSVSADDFLFTAFVEIPLQKIDYVFLNSKIKLSPSLVVVFRCPHIP